MPGIRVHFHFHVCACVHVNVRVQVHIHVLFHFHVPEHERKHEYFVNNRQLQVWSNYNKRQMLEERNRPSGLNQNIQF